METTTGLLPDRVDVPEWDRGPEHQPLRVTTLDKVTFDGELGAMGEDDVYIDGKVTYRGHTYEVRCQHTCADGTPKGYAGNGRDYGPVTSAWQRARFFTPSAPETYVTPMITAIAAAVSTYRSEFADHVAASIHAHAAQDLNRAASSYNTKARELAELFVKVQAAQARV